MYAERNTLSACAASQAIDRPVRRVENSVSEAEMLVQMAIDARVMLGDNIDRLIGAQPCKADGAGEAPLPSGELSDLDMRLMRLRSILADIRDQAQRLTAI